MTPLKALPPRVRTINTQRIALPPKKADPFYSSPEWKALLGRIIKARGRRCQDAEHSGPHDPTARIYGDHIVELRDGGAPLADDNVLLRCASCHTRKTAAARMARLRG